MQLCFSLRIVMAQATIIKDVAPYPGSGPVTLTTMDASGSLLYSSEDSANLSDQPRPISVDVNFTPLRFSLNGPFLLNTPAVIFSGNFRRRYLVNEKYEIRTKYSIPINVARAAPKLGKVIYP